MTSGAIGEVISPYVRFSADEAVFFIEEVCFLPRRARGEVHGTGSPLVRYVQSGVDQGRGDPLASVFLIDDDIFDPCPRPGRDRENGKRRRSDDVMSLRSGDEQEGVRVVDDRLQSLGIKVRTRRELSEKGNEAIEHLGRYLAHLLDRTGVVRHVATH